MQFKNIRLLADIFSGYSLRKSVSSYLHGKIGVIQNKDIKDADVNIEKISYIDIFPKDSLYLSEGDILFSSRGNFSAVLIKNMKQKVIASSSFFVFRIKNKKILPEFLVLYLNSKEGQRKILSKTSGTAVKTILKQDLENIKIPILPLKLQEKILAISSQSKKIEQLYERKIKLHKQNSQYILSTLLSQK